jgi:hypothetical protein
VNQYKSAMFICEIELASPCFFWYLSQISDDETSIETCQEGETAQDPSGKIMEPWSFNVKFPYGTQLTFGSLMFAMREDGNLKLLTQGPAPKRLASVYWHPPYLLASSSTSGGVCLGLNPYAGPYHCAAKMTWGIPIETPIFQSSAETLSSSTSAASPDQDSSDDYPEIGGSTC